MTADILASILAYKAEEVRAGRREASIADLEVSAKAHGPTRGFADALVRACRPGGLALIAEIKKASPSKGLIRKDFDPATLAGAYERGGAACLSVLTDGPSFQGAHDDLAAARKACDLPCLRKDFLIDPWQVLESRALGADAILVILAACDDILAADLANEARRLDMDALFEAHDAEELDRANALGATLIGINNRDLSDFVTDLAVTERLAPMARPEALVVSESGIVSAADAHRLAKVGARAMLVGETLMRQANVETATRALVAPP
jgi:indole-3-glycerol phosphate synthase